MKKNISSSITIWMYYQKTDLHYQNSIQIFANGTFFSSNLTEDVYELLVDIFTRDNKRERHFQTLPEETHDASAELKAVPFAESDKVLKGLLLSLLFSSDLGDMNIWLVSVLLLGAYQKLSVRAKGTTVCQFLSGTIFLNFHHLHPEFQKIILLCIKSVYKSKKEVQVDVTFLLIISISVCAFPTFSFCSVATLLPLSFSFQQFLCSTMSAFWGLGIGCLIEHFENDIEKIVHAFYPLFKTWVQQDYHSLKKLSDISISIRR